MSWLVALMLLMFSGVVFRVVVLNHTAVVGPYVLYLDQRNQRVVPVGTIISWDSAVRNNAGEPIGQLRDLPKGWRICNGRDGTLDLTSVFLRDDSESGRTGGLSSGNSGSVDPKKTDLNNHKHQLPINNWAGGGYSVGPKFGLGKDPQQGEQFVAIPASGQAYTGKYKLPDTVHETDLNAHVHNVETVPLCYSVIFIMKVE